MESKEAIGGVTDLINSSGHWQYTEFIVFSTLLLVSVLLIVFYISQKNIVNFVDYLQKGNEVLNRHSITIEKSIESHERTSQAMQNFLDKSLKHHEDTLEIAQKNNDKLEEMHFDIRNIHGALHTRRADDTNVYK